MEQHLISSKTYSRRCTFYAAEMSQLPNWRVSYEVRKNRRENVCLNKRVSLGRDRQGDVIIVPRSVVSDEAVFNEPRGCLINVSVCLLFCPREIRWTCTRLMCRYRSNSELHRILWTKDQAVPPRAQVSRLHAGVDQLSCGSVFYQLIIR